MDTAVGEAAGAARAVHYNNFVFDFVPPGEPVIMTARHDATMRRGLDKSSPTAEISKAMALDRLDELRADPATRDTVRKVWAEAGVNAVGVTLGCIAMDTAGWDQVLWDAAYWQARVRAGGDMEICTSADALEAARRAGESAGELLPDEEARRRLFPNDEWYGEFELSAGKLIPPLKLAKEVRRIREKSQELESTCRGLGFSLGELYAAVERARRMFLDPDGEFAWYFERMTLARREGSFLFVHAGVDDTVARVLSRQGVAALNAWYHRLFADDLFDLYHGPVGNAFRTKYRDIDYPLTERGLGDLHDAGIYAIVHGHRNILHGQRLTLRAGVLNFECDASVDRNTRTLEGLAGPGGAVVSFLPSGRVQAISTDYPFIKDFDSARVFQFTSLMSREDHPTMSATPEEALAPVDVNGLDDDDDDGDASGGKGKAKSKAKIKFSSSMQRGEAVAYFSALVDGLRHGRLQFRHGEESVALEPSERVTIEVKAARKGDKERVSFELEWKRSGRESLEVDG